MPGGAGRGMKRQRGGRGDRERAVPRDREVAGVHEHQPRVVAHAAAGNQGGDALAGLFGDPSVDHEAGGLGGRSRIQPLQGRGESVVHQREEALAEAVTLLAKEAVGGVPVDRIDARGRGAARLRPRDRRLGDRVERRAKFREVGEQRCVVVGETIQPVVAVGVERLGGWAWAEEGETSERIVAKTAPSASRRGRMTERGRDEARSHSVWWRGGGSEMPTGSRKMRRAPQGRAGKSCRDRWQSVP